jgi:hypothetical protein
MSLITFESSIETFLNLVLIINIFRIIQCTSLHPRLATLTGTLFRAIDDLWHTSILIVLILGCFAAIGTWRFGSFRKEFASISDSLTTELSMMFSANFFDRWDASLELQVYTVLFLVIVFLLILNFLLAIIVDAFMDIRKHNVELDIEQEFFTDVMSIMLSRTLGRYRGWPSPGKLGFVLAQQKAKINVGFMDLHKTGLFKDPVSISSFIKFYGEYDFLQPIHVTKWGKPPSNKNEELLVEIRKMNLTLLTDLKISFSQVFGIAALPSSKLKADRSKGNGPKPENSKCAAQGPSHAKADASDLSSAENGVHGSFDSLLVSYHRDQPINDEGSIKKSKLHSSVGNVQSPNCQGRLDCEPDILVNHAFEHDSCGTESTGRVSFAIPSMAKYSALSGMVYIPMQQESEGRALRSGENEIEERLPSPVVCDLDRDI